MPVTTRTQNLASGPAAAPALVGPPLASLETPHRSTVSTGALTTPSTPQDQSFRSKRGSGLIKALLSAPHWTLQKEPLSCFTDRFLDMVNRKPRRNPVGNLFRTPSKIMKAKDSATPTTNATEDRFQEVPESSPALIRRQMGDAVGSRDTAATTGQQMRLGDNVQSPRS